MTGLFSVAVEALEPLGEQDADLRAVLGRIETSSQPGSLINYLGKECFERGLHNRARCAFERLLELEPGRPSALEYLAKSLIKLGEDEAAMAVLVRLVDTEAAGEHVREWARTRLGVLGAGSSRPRAVPPAAAVPEQPQEMRAALIRALEKRNIVTQYGSVDLTQLERVEAQLGQDPDNPALLEWYAFLLYSNHRIGEAIAVYLKVVTGHGATPHALYYLGAAYLKAFDTVRAFECWDALREGFPDSPLLARVEAKSLRLRELGDGATPAAGRAGFTRLLRNIKAALDTVAPAASAASAASAAPQAPHSSPDSPSPSPTPSPSPSSRVSSAVSFTDHDVANGVTVEQVETLVAAEPDNVQFLEWAAFVHYCHGNLGRSQELYLKALEVGPESADALYYLGAVTYRTGRDLEAVDRWNALIDRFGDHRLAKKARAKMQALYHALLE